MYPQMPPLPPQPISTVPGKVQAAQGYLYYANGIRLHPPAFDGMPGVPGELSSKEQSVYDAALDVLQAYFRGEMDFADGDQSSKPGPDGPTDRVPVLQ